MGDQTTTANPPAASGGIDTDAITKAITASVTAAMSEAMKPITEQLGKLQAPPAQQQAANPSTGSGQAAKPLTADDVKTMLADAFKTQTQTVQQENARKGFLADKLKDLPPAYQNQLGSDPAKWATEEQAIRTQYRADFKIAGGKTADVGGTTAGGTPAKDTVDTSKLSPVQNILAGLKKEGGTEKKADAAAA